MAPPKEGPQAFMPTSNDALHFPVNGGEIYSLQQSRSQSSAKPVDELAVTSDLPDESTLLSPPYNANQSEGSVSPTNMTALPTRPSISSASLLPGTELPPPTDQSFWHDQYYRTLELHNKERRLWDEERQFLHREFTRLRKDAQRKQSSSGPSHLKGKENDKVYPDAEIIRQSQEKLRTLSNASHIAELSSIPYGSTRKYSQDDKPPEETTIPHHASASDASTTLGQRLTSIQEDDPVVETGRRVSINDISTTIEQRSENGPHYEEDPRSPPTTTDIPTPPNAKIHAGRTPPIPIATANGRLNGSGNNAAATFYGAVHDEDPELDSPKILPSAPSNGYLPSELSDLSKKLELVASDPEGNLPEVVRAATEADDHSMSPTTQPDSQATREVKLKTKRSLNFGAPLGAPFRDHGMS